MMTETEQRKLIRDVIAEERAEQLAHPSRRERVTKFTDPDGNTWISRTLSRAEEARRLFGLIAFAFGICAAAFTTYYNLVVLPDVDAHAAAQISAHDEAARRRMDEVAAQILFKKDFDAALAASAWVAEKEQRWKYQDEFNQRIELTLIEMQRDIKELLRRVR